MGSSYGILFKRFNDIIRMRKKLKHFTKTATFVFPLLGISKATFKCEKTTFSKTETLSRFNNAFLHDGISGKYDNHVSILINNYRDVKFDDFYTNVSSHETFVDSYEIDEALIMVFAIPEDKMDDFNCILEGRYSEISPDSKQLIISNHFFDNSSTVIPMILHKSDALRKIWEDKIGVSLEGREVWGVMVKDFETLTMSKLDKVISKKLKPSKEFE